MKFTEIKPINQIESNLFVRHKVNAMEEGNPVQRCVRCGEIVQDRTGWINVSGDETISTGYGEGYLYINKSSNTGMTITEAAIKLGICRVPEEVVDCIAVNS